MSQLQALSEALGLGRSFSVAAAEWRQDTLVLDLADGSGARTRVMLDPREDMAGPAFATTKHLRITYQGRSIPEPLQRELTALAVRIDGLTFEGLASRLPRPASSDRESDGGTGPERGMRAPTETQLGGLPAVLGLRGPDDPRSDLRLCAAEWWEDELVLEVDGPELRPAILSLAPRRGDRSGFRATDHFWISYETEFTEALRGAMDELSRRWAELTLAAIEAAFPSPGRVLRQAESEASAKGGSRERPRGLDAEDAVSRGWATEGQWRRFFCSWEVDRNILRSVRLSHEAVYVEHGDLECLHSTPGVRKRVPSFVNYPWLAEQPSSGPGEGDSLELRRERAPVYTTDMNEADVVLGAAGKLASLVDEVSKRHPGRPIHFNCTCPPIVIADDVAPILVKLRKKHDAPVVHTTQDPGSSLHLFASMLRGREGMEMAEPDPDALNLVGFTADRGREELIALLDELGLRVNAMLIPSAPPEHVARYRRAHAQVFFPNAPWRVMYHAAFHDLPMESVWAPPPYGVRGMREWLLAVAAPFGREALVDEVWQRRMEMLAPRWDRLVREAREHRLLFVVDRHDWHRLIDPGRMGGRPILEMLDEMGFGVDLLCFGGHDGLLEEVRGRGLEASAFSTRDELAAALRASSAKAVYSEVFTDRRLTRAGKAEFHAGMFQQGMEGAVRTLERLLSICRLPFYRRLGRYLEAPRV